jgi:cyclopropane-fatty-acyl-phospholipid synthase
MPAIAERHSSAREFLEDFFRPADVRFDGGRRWDICVQDARVFERVFRDGSLGLGEAYMDGWWDCDDLEELCRRILVAELDGRGLGVRRKAWHAVRARILNLQNPIRARRVAREHYDLGNDLYQAMLDENMQYTCAYWKRATSLAEAQQHKLELVAQKLMLEPGMTVLELGSGFGGLARYLAAEARCKVVSYNISVEQIRFARDICRNLPVEFIHDDYRAAHGKFDRVVSVGMFEHVGHKNHRAFMQLVHDRLNDDGLALVHTIGKHVASTSNDSWTDRYIFPNYMTPSPLQISAAFDGLLVLEDWHCFAREDYARTLRDWHKNFVSAWSDLQQRYGERFFRMWKYYLLMAAGVAMSGKGALWQIVLSKSGLPNRYEAIR